MDIPAIKNPRTIKEKVNTTAAMENIRLRFSFFLGYNFNINLCL